MLLLVLQPIKARNGLPTFSKSDLQNLQRDLPKCRVSIEDGVINEVINILRNVISFSNGE
jgi:hypothetical protein